MINTTHGYLDESMLSKTTIFEDRPTEFVVAVEWRLGDELVRRDAHVVKKQEAPVEAVASIGGM